MKCMRVLGVVIAITILAGCSDPKIDASSDEAMKVSVEMVRKSLPEAKRKDFDEAMQVIEFGIKDHITEGVAGVGDPSDPADIHSGSIWRQPTATDVWNHKKAFENLAKVHRRNVRRSLDGKTGEQVIAEAERIKGPVREEQSYGDYIVRIYSMENGNGSFEILRNGVCMYTAYGYRFRIGSIYGENKTNNLISIGSDITGDGEPNLVVSEWTGGAHCCYFFYIFEIGDRFRYIQTIDAGNSYGNPFKNVDGDSALEFLMSDWTFAYWRTCYASSPAPTVILKYTGKKYVMDYDLMRKPKLPHDDLIQMAIAIRVSHDWRQEPPPVELWAKMLDLIYTGNMNQAWTLAELSWPAGIDGKEQFLKDFRSKLAQSPFWEDIQKMNK